MRASSSSTTDLQYGELQALAALLARFMASPSLPAIARTAADLVRDDVLCLLAAPGHVCPWCLKPITPGQEASHRHARGGV